MITRRYRLVTRLKMTPPWPCRSRYQTSQRLTSEAARLSVVHEREFRPAYEVKTGTFDPQTTFGRPGILRSPLTSEQKFCKIEVKKQERVFKIISNLTPLPVIASFSINGKMVPIYVQFFPGEKPIRVSAKCIANAVTYAEYICEYMLEDDENIHSVNLIYQKDKQIWGARATR